MNDIREALVNDPTKELVTLLKEESRRQEARDEKFLEIMERMAHPIAPQTLPSQCPAPAAMPYINWYMSMLQNNEGGALQKQQYK